MREIFDFDQGSPEWFAARAGIPTASEFHTVLAKGKDGGASVTRRKYMMRLAGELITGEVEETYSNSHMDRGKALEDQARDFYSFMTDAEPQRVGFIRNGNAGCSPDSLIGTAGMLEIKTALPSIVIDVLERDRFPPEHKAQVQGGLWIAEREWMDCVVYWPKLPLFVSRAYRDEPYIRTLAAAVDAFNEELAATVERVRSYTGASTLKRQLADSLAQEPAPHGRDKSGRPMSVLEAG